MATPKIIADFETQLATAISAGDTSFTLASATDDDGVALPAGDYYFTVNNGRSNKEYLSGTLSGTTVSSVVSVSRQALETSGANNAHRIGDSVIITDFATYKKYMDEIALVSAPDADTGTKGVVEEATTAEIDAGTATGGTGAELFVAPDALSTSIYSTRLPSADEKTYLTNIEQGSLTPEVVSFTTSGTWTKDSGLKYIVVEAVGGGGGGGGAQADSADYSQAAGGGAGGYSRRVIPAATLGSTETVTIGAAGTAGSGTGGDGGNGGNTTFGSLLTANGGTGGSGDDGSGAGGPGGTATTGDINVPGGDGGPGLDVQNSTTPLGAGTGMGGSSFFGGGGAAGATDSGAGSAGSAYGSGGGGATSNNSEARAGGAGEAGLVVVTEYYS